MNYYYSGVRLLYIVITHNWRIALSDSQFQKAKAAQLDIESSVIGTENRPGSAGPRYSPVVATVNVAPVQGPDVGDAGLEEDAVDLLDLFLSRYLRVFKSGA